MVVTGENRSTWSKYCPGTTMCTSNTTQTSQGLKEVLRSQYHTTNHYSAELCLKTLTPPSPPTANKMRIHYKYETTNVVEYSHLCSQ